MPTNAFDGISRVGQTYPTANACDASMFSHSGSRTYIKCSDTAKAQFAGQVAEPAMQHVHRHEATIAGTDISPHHALWAMPHTIASAFPGGGAACTKMLNTVALATSISTCRDVSPTMVPCAISRVVGPNEWPCILYVGVPVIDIDSLGGKRQRQRSLLLLCAAGWHRFRPSPCSKRCALRANLRSLQYREGGLCCSGDGHKGRSVRLNEGTIDQPAPLHDAGHILINGCAYQRFANAGEGNCLRLAMTQHQLACNTCARLGAFSLRAPTLHRVHRFNIQCTQLAKDRISALGRWADESTHSLFCQAHPDLLSDVVSVYAYTWGCWVKFRPDGSSMQICEAPQSRCVLLLHDNPFGLLRPASRAVSPGRGCIPHLVCTPACVPHSVFYSTQGHQLRLSGGGSIAHICKLASGGRARAHYTGCFGGVLTNMFPTGGIRGMAGPCLEPASWMQPSLAVRGAPLRCMTGVSSPAVCFNGLCSARAQGLSCLDDDMMGVCLQFAADTLGIPHAMCVSRTFSRLLSGPHVWEELQLGPAVCQGHCVCLCAVCNSLSEAGCRYGAVSVSRSAQTFSSQSFIQSEFHVPFADNYIWYVAGRLDPVQTFRVSLSAMEPHFELTFGFAPSCDPFDVCAAVTTCHSFTDYRGITLARHVPLGTHLGVACVSRWVHNADVCHVHRCCYVVEALHGSYWTLICCPQAFAFYSDGRVLSRAATSLSHLDYRPDLARYLFVPLYMPGHTPAVWSSASSAVSFLASNVVTLAVYAPMPPWMHPSFQGGSSTCCSAFHPCKQMRNAAPRRRWSDMTSSESDEECSAPCHLQPSGDTHMHAPPPVLGVADRSAAASGFGGASSKCDHCTGSRTDGQPPCLPPDADSCSASMCRSMRDLRQVAVYPEGIASGCRKAPVYVMQCRDVVGLLNGFDQYFYLIPGSLTRCLWVRCQHTGRWGDADRPPIAHNKLVPADVQVIVDVLPYFFPAGIAVWISCQNTWFLVCMPSDKVQLRDVHGHIGPVLVLMSWDNEGYGSIAVSTVYSFSSTYPHPPALMGFCARCPLPYL